VASSEEASKAGASPPTPEAPESPKPEEKSENELLLEQLRANDQELGDLSFEIA
jgi:hypothetical protein